MVAAGLVMIVGGVEKVDAAADGDGTMIWLVAALVVWLGAWALNVWLSHSRMVQSRVGRLLVPAMFGVTVLVVWEFVVLGLKVPGVILPPPSAIWTRILGSLDLLGKDFYQTFVKGALTGYVMGCGAAFLTAIAIDRSEFLQRGLAADREFCGGAADCGHRADPGDVVRL